MAGEQDNVIPLDKPPLLPDGSRAQKVPMEWYRGLKSKITTQLQLVENFVKDFTTNKTVVRSQEEKDNIYKPLNKAEDALEKWDKYLNSHSTHEAWVQDRQEGYVDEDLTSQTASYAKYDEKYQAYVVKLNRLCSDFNASVGAGAGTGAGTSRRRERSQTQVYGPAAPNVVIVRDDEATRLNDSTRPDKLNHNASILQFLNWKRDIKTYFTMNSMDKKPHSVQVSVFFGCVDENLKRFLHVHFANLPNVPLVAEDENSYLLALTNHFNQKHPVPVCVLNFFNERQRPNESASDFAQRCEALAIVADVENMKHDDLVKYKIATGLVHSETLRTKLLKNLTDPKYTTYKLKKEIEEHTATEKVTSVIEKQMQVSQVNQLSTYKKNVSSSRAQGYQQRFRQNHQLPRIPFQPRPNSFRPSAPRPGSNNACRQCGFIPFYNCQTHFRPRQQQQQLRQPRPFQQRVHQIREPDMPEATASNDQEDDDIYVNTLSTLADVSDRQINALDIALTQVGRQYPRDQNGLPRMPNQRQTPLLYAFIRQDKRRNYYPFYNVQTPITEVLCMADSGAVQSVMHPNLARLCALEIDYADKTIMYAANGHQLQCEGSASVQISYFGLFTDLKIYIMSEVSENYIIIDRHVCQYLGILPYEFPLPLRMCTIGNLRQPVIHPNAPFRAGNVRNQYKNLAPYPADVLQLTGEAQEKQMGNGLVEDSSKIKVKTSFNLKCDEDSALTRINKVIEKYICVFDIHSKKDIKVTPVRLRFKKDVQVVPFKCTSARPIPFALRAAARKEVEEQIKLGILARVPPDTPIEWCSRGMIIAKDNARDCRIVCDSVELNKYLDRDAYPIQSSRELVKQIPPSSKVFLSVDFYKGFFQIPVAKEDQLKTTFMLHSLGLFHYKRLMQGGSTSVDLFNRITDELVQDVPNCLKMVDDVLFHGPTVDDVLAQFEVLLKKCQERNFTLHPKKIAFGNKLVFAGYGVSDKGLSIDPRKVEAIRKFDRPGDVTDMKSFLGLAAQFQDACPNLMGTLKPLIDTTSYKVTPGFDPKTHKKIKNKNRKIDWNPNLEEAFIKAKKLLTDADGQVLRPFDPSLPLIIFTDASRLNGFGWIAMQEHQGIKYLVECGSSTIPDIARRNFSVSELELAAVELALRKMRLITVANPNIIVKTDHMPLIGILKKPLDKIDTRRLMKLAEKLQSYTFQLEYVAGVKNEIADALSRNPVTEHGPGDVDVLHVIFDNDENITLPVMDKYACQDEDYVKIREAVVKGTKAQNLPPDHPGRRYRDNWHLLGTFGNLVILGDTILVPKALRKEILQKLHFAHLGQHKTVALAKQFYFWRGMSAEIQQMVEACETCQVNANFQQKETMRPQYAKYPMEMNTADLAEYGGKNYLIHADRFSGYVWVYHLNRTTTQDVIKCLWETFYKFGFPKVLSTDNGPQFISDAFIQKCRMDGIEQRWSSPLHSAGNGYAERSVATAKNMIKKAEHPGDLQRMLLFYNTTPTSSSRSPSELFFSRKIRNSLPRLESAQRMLSPGDIKKAVDKRNKLSEARKVHYDKSAKDLPTLRLNQNVRIYNLNTSKWDTVGRVVRCDEKNSRSYRIETQNGNFIWRNRIFIKPIVKHKASEAKPT